MARINLIDQFNDFKEEENIDRPTLMKVLEDVFKTILRKKYGEDDNFDVIVNDQTGDLEIFRRREIVADDELEDELSQVSLSYARKQDEDYEVGEELYEEIFVQDFGRRAVLAAKQTLNSRINDIKKDNIMRIYEDRVGELVTGEVYQIWRKEILVLDDDGNELILPKSEQIPTDRFRKGETLRAVVKKVDVKNGTPYIILSRTHPAFLEKLMEIEVPEIFDGLIVIRKIVREPGERAKVAVESYDDRIDPVGACVGMKGSRIHGIVRELRNENIDVINFTNNEMLYIQRALTPAKINRIEFVKAEEPQTVLNEEGEEVLVQEQPQANVFLPHDQISLAIGRKGVNINLAEKLTGYSIDVHRDDNKELEFDIKIEEFGDEIDQWMIDELKKIGLDTAKSVLNLSVEDLVRRSDLEEETIVEIRRILEEEFED